MSLLHRARRLAALVGVALVSACSGGWTGEITVPSVCHDVTGSRALSELGPAERALLETVAATTTAPMHWEIEGGGETEVVTSARTTGDADVMGGEDCDQPWLRVPVELAVRTADGRLDVLLPGTIALPSDDGAATARVTASAPTSQLHADLAIDGEGTLRVDVSVNDDASHGEIHFAPSSGSDELLLASW